VIRVFLGDVAVGTVVVEVLTGEINSDAILPLKVISDFEPTVLFI
jgi:hypothetical protein